MKLALVALALTAAPSGQAMGPFVPDTDTPTVAPTKAPTLPVSCRSYAKALVLDDSTTVDDLCEAVTTLEDAERIARRVLGGAHPLVEHIEYALGRLGEALRARETPSSTPS